MSLHRFGSLSHRDIDRMREFHDSRELDRYLDAQDGPDEDEPQDDYWTALEAAEL